MAKLFKTEMGKEFMVVDAYVNNIAGCEHKVINVTLRYYESKKKFSSVTDNMSDCGKASDLDYQEMCEALFELIQNNLKYLIEDWIFDIDEDGKTN